MYLIIGVGLLALAVSTLKGFLGLAYGSAVTPVFLLRAESLEYYNLVVMASLILISLAAVTASGRLHPILIAVLSPLALVAGMEEAAMMMLFGLAALVAASGVIEGSGCPFKTDKNLVMVGSMLAVTSIGAMLAVGAALPFKSLWVLGFLLLVSGLLVPATASHMRPS